MPRAIMSKAEVLDRLMDSFRRHGYDGASLATLSERTGLGRSSLYHHFPGGKEQMALDVLAHLRAGFAKIYRAVESEPDPREKLNLLLEAIDAFYVGGEKACLLERLVASVDRKAFQVPLRATFTDWMAAFAGIGRASGLTSGLAQRRAEDAVVRIEGALIVAVGMGDTRVFRRALDQIRATILVR